MKSRKLVVRMVTPAFLGGADQTGEWRTPPFKALLRQWWRVVYGPKVNFDEAELREAEGVLWGHAWLKHPGTAPKPRAWSLSSRIVLALRPLPTPVETAGTERRLTTGAEVLHPRVQAKGGMRPGPNGQGAYVGSLLYLGYGPLGTKGQNHPPALAAKTATAELRLAWDYDVDDDIDLTLKLVHLFGCVGGRSRNGFGSVELLDEGGKPLVPLDDIGTVFPKVSADCERCLKLDWSHAIGTGFGKPLIWRSQSAHESWQDALKELAEIKIGCLVQMGYDPMGHSRIARRHLANYPVTHHAVHPWDAHKPPFRLANQLRFKVHRVQGNDGNDKFVAIAFHLPHRLPKPLLDKLTREDQRWVRENELEVWRKVHAVLDEKMARLG